MKLWNTTFDLRENTATQGVIHQKMLSLIENKQSLKIFFLKEK